MNTVNLIGRLTRDPETRETQNGLSICGFSIAVDRPGKEKQTDYPRIKVFGKTAESCQKYLTKGSLVGIVGRIQTGSYKDKNGNTVYTTDVVADKVDFIPSAQKREEPKPEQVDFAMLDEAVPF